MVKIDSRDRESGTVGKDVRPEHKTNEGKSKDLSGAAQIQDLDQGGQSSSGAVTFSVKS